MALNLWCERHQRTHKNYCPKPYDYHCNRCQKDFESGSDSPDICPNCKSKTWYKFTNELGKHRPGIGDKRCLNCGTEHSLKAKECSRGRKAFPHVKLRDDLT